eukprot:SM000261S09976  [mRNA]  locus=s261:6583:7508:- [translate_table: standard]
MEPIAASLASSGMPGRAALTRLRCGQPAFDGVPDGTATASIRSSLDLLERLASPGRAGSEPGDSRRRQAGAASIAEQLKGKLEESNEEDEVRLALVRPELTISQRRNIRRQAYLDTVAKRNDVPLFLGIGLAILLPPAGILGYLLLAGFIEVPF